MRALFFSKWLPKRYKCYNSIILKQICFIFDHCLEQKKIQDSSNLNYFTSIVSRWRFFQNGRQNIKIYHFIGLYNDLKKRNRNGNVLTNMVYDQSDIATLFKPKHGRITQRRGVEVDSRTSSHVGQGSQGWSPLFSRPHICLDIVTPCGRSGNRFLNKPSVWKHT